MGDSWVGGDIAGLQHMGQTLTSAQHDLEGVVKPLSGKVDALVGDAGWKGEAAEEFRRKWSDDALTAGALSTFVGEIGATLTQLADNLSSAENALYNAAHEAQRQGVAVGPKGEPQPLMTSDPPSIADQKAIAGLKEYDIVYRTIVQSAQQARLDAAERLKKLYDDVNPDGSMKKADQATVSALLRDLYAVKDDMRSAAAEKAEAELKRASAQTDSAYDALSAEQRKLKAAGKGIPADLPEDAAYRQSMHEVKTLYTQLDSIEHSRTTFDKAVNYKLTDAVRDYRIVEGADKLPDFLKDVPVLDIAAATAAAGFEADEDHEKGWSWTHSVVVDGGAALGGLAAGAAVVAAAPEELVGGAAAATGAAVAGGVMLVTVGVDKAFHEHWSEDIHDHGVLGGVAHGTADVASGSCKTVWGAMKGLGSGIANVF